MPVTLQSTFGVQCEPYGEARSAVLKLVNTYPKIRLKEITKRTTKIFENGIVWNWVKDSNLLIFTVHRKYGKKTFRVRTKRNEKNLPIFFEKTAHKQFWRIKKSIRCSWRWPPKIKKYSNKEIVDILHQDYIN